jgi:hypothetical protein
MASPASKIIEHLTFALGRELSDFSGMRATKLSAQLAKGAVNASVVSTFKWPESGKVTLDGIIYDYASKTITTFNGLTWTEEDGTVNVGAKQQHEPDALVLDLSKKYNALDVTTNEFFLDTAVGEGLAILARNKGVFKPSTLLDDEVFRKIVQNIAFVPKGRLVTIRRMLRALFGEGNFEVWEEYPDVKNTVFIKITGGFALASDSSGKGYLTARERVPLDSGTLRATLTQIPLVVGSVTLADEGLVTEFPFIKPSEVLETRYLGDAGLQAWEFIGGGENEAAWAIPAVLSGNVECCALRKTNVANTPQYRHSARILPATASIEMGMTLSFFAGSTVKNGFALGFSNQVNRFTVGVYNDSGNYAVALINRTTGAVIGDEHDTGIAIGLNNAIDVRIAREHGAINVYVNGLLVLTHTNDASFPADSENEFFFGQFDTSSTTTNARVIRAWFHAHTDTQDFWNTRAVAAVTASADSLIVAGPISTADIGKYARVFDAASPAEPQNSGQHSITNMVTTGNPDEFTVTLGDSPGNTLASVLAAVPGVIFIGDNARRFRFPDDVGRKIRLVGANAGTYTISAVADEEGELEHPGDGASVLVSDGPVAWVTESNIEWYYVPNFTFSESVEVDVVATGSVADTEITLRQFPSVVPGTVVGWKLMLDVSYSFVRSGQMVQSTAIRNDPVGSRAPLYLPAPLLGPLDDFLDELTAAGVIPEVQT